MLDLASAPRYRAAAIVERCEFDHCAGQVAVRSPPRRRRQVPRGPPPVHPFFTQRTPRCGPISDQGVAVMQASYRRIGLSFCLDLILIYGLVRWFLFFAGFGMDYGFLVALGVTALVRAVLHGAVASPGMHMLSIDRQYSVDADVLTRESWLTLLLGISLAWAGVEDTLRWMGLPWGGPFFGGLPSSSSTG